MFFFFYGSLPNLFWKTCENPEKILRADGGEAMAAAHSLLISGPENPRPGLPI
jgi:hypothetical protein